MSRIIAAIALLFASLFAAAPAQAAPAVESVSVPSTTCVLGICIGGKVYHDGGTGYEPSIVVACNFGGPLSFVAVGTSSKEDCGTDTDQIYIRAGEELWCWNNGFHTKEFDAEGRHKIIDSWSKACTLRKD